jgi:hypothetical protein
MLLAGCILFWGGEVAAAQTLNGKVLGGGQPIINVTIALWATGTSAPTQLGQARTGADGSFTLNSTDAANKDAILYRCIELARLTSCLTPRRDVGNRRQAMSSSQ